MKIAIVGGAGYVGLVSGSCIADLGFDVTCIDLDQNKINQLLSGKAPIYEPGLDVLIEKNLASGRLHFTANLESGITGKSIVFLCVGTPTQANGSADLTYIWQAVDAIGRLWKSNPYSGMRILITKSTVPIGTGKKIAARLNELGLADSEVAVVSNPEFLREGSAVQDFFKPDRTVLGGTNAEAVEQVAKIYKSIYRNDGAIIRTDLETSEMIKYAANAFLATKITFINEIANLCDAVNADVGTVARGIGADGRIGKYFLHPGPGYGGSCFPKDTLALDHIAQEVQVPLKLVKAVIEANTHQRQVVVDKIFSCFDSPNGKTVAILGAAFKPNTDDVRETPVAGVVALLLNAGMRVQIYDPIALNNFKHHYNFGERVRLCQSVDECVDQAHVLVVMTEWNEFRNIDLADIKSRMADYHVVDARNVFEPNAVKSLGFSYRGIGRR